MSWKLLAFAEAFTYPSREGITYHMAVVKRGGDIRFSVDGKAVLAATDSQPLAGDLLGLRTYRTWLWWSNLRLWTFPTIVAGAQTNPSSSSSYRLSALSNAPG